MSDDLLTGMFDDFKRDLDRLHALCQTGQQSLPSAWREAQKLASRYATCAMMQLIIMWKIEHGYYEESNSDNQTELKEGEHE